MRTSFAPGRDEPPDPAVAEAAARIGRAAPALQRAADEFGIDLATGTFPERDAHERLVVEGKVTETKARAVAQGRTSSRRRPMPTAAPTRPPPASWGSADGDGHCVKTIRDAAGRDLSDDEVLQIAERIQQHRTHAGASSHYNVAQGALISAAERAVAADYPPQPPSAGRWRQANRTRSRPATPACRKRTCTHNPKNDVYRTPELPIASISGRRKRTSVASKSGAERN